MVVNRAGLKVVLGHPERFFYLEEPVIRADHELRGHGGPVGAGGEVGDVPLDPGQGLGPGLELAGDALGGAVEGYEPVPLDREAGEQVPGPGRAVGGS